MEHIKVTPSVYVMMPNELVNFVHNIAQAGDIETTYDSATKKRYVYFCTEKTIGKDVNPVWMMIDEKSMLKKMFENMTLEQKVDFLINKYIEDLCK